MILPNAAGQPGLHRAFRADGTLSSNSVLVLPQAMTRCQFMIMNISAAPMYMDHGCARANAVITSGAVTSLTISNGGFGFTIPPLVTFAGGGGQGTGVNQGNAGIIANSSWNGRGLLGSPPPSGTSPTVARPAVARSVLTSGVVTSFIIDDPGAGYVNPPEVILTNDPRDPFGCADPSVGSGSGVYLAANGGSYYLNGTAMWMDAVALWGTNASKFTCEYML